ncbi:LysM peptidoglycan-binding domain-containing protein [Cohnella sp. NL03-T5]|nr:LysM peptidoglycan-binding domain-containing protein [Cohnella silvisoli]
MVKQGDTLYLIAKKYNVSLEDIIKANPEISNPDAIDVGMKVKIPSQPKTAMEVIHHHIVQQGDTLWKLSKAWGIQLADMIKANPQLKNPNALLTGEVVNIPKTPNGSASPGATMHGNSTPGKANTGMKAETGVQIQPVPMPLPAPQPAPIIPNVPVAPPPAPVMPIKEMKPTYGVEVHEHTNLFMQFPVPMVQATAHVEEPYCPEPMPHGYGMQQLAMSPENAGYGHDYGHGYSQEYSLAFEPGISPLEGNIAGNIGGLYSHHDFSGYGIKPSTGCKTCGAPKPWPTSVEANQGAIPYVESYPGMGYPGGNVPYGVQPIGVSPFGASPYGNMPQAVSPIGNYPGMHYGGHYNMPMGDIPVGYSPIAEGLPGIGGSNVHGMVSPAMGYGYGPQGEPYYGGIPPIPTMPGIPPMPPFGPVAGGNGFDDRSSSSDGGIDIDSEGDVKVTALSVKKRQSKPKPKQRASRQIRSKSKESLPWIKW